MRDAAARSGVKTAYAATGRYAPAIIHAQALCAEGTIGTVRSVESVLHLGLPPNLPYCWVHERARGGGLLNNVFTHKLAQVLRITGGMVLRASGLARLFPERVPVGPAIHDFRDLFAGLGDWAPDATTEWRAPDADAFYAVMVDLHLPDGSVAQASFHGDAIGVAPVSEYLLINGSQAALYLSAAHDKDDHVRRFMPEQQLWADLPTPREIEAALPPDADRVQRCWNQLFRDFVADVRGQGSPAYPTFEDGWLACEIIEAALTGHQPIELTSRSQELQVPS
jgi:predicted dehydrogenase